MIVDSNNLISETAKVPDFVRMGSFNKIGDNVVIEAAKGAKNPTLVLGDCNIINDNVRILVGDAGVYIKDWNVIHNNILIIGEDRIEIGHNCWFGQNTILDGSGQLTIGNGVRVGMYSQIWTHVGSGEQIEGCVLFLSRATSIQDDVWLVGSCVVGAGITMGKRSICLINSVVTIDTLPNHVYNGSPAKVVNKANFYRKVDLTEKFDMMLAWSNQFAETNPEIKIDRTDLCELKIEDLGTKEILIFSETHQTNHMNNLDVTTFSMSDKTFRKRNTSLERKFYAFIYNNKARFIPIN